VSGTFPQPIDARIGKMVQLKKNADVDSYEAEAGFGAGKRCGP
jgi:hypothetical protein